MKYNQAPLPFQGQKRMFLKDFSEVIKLFPKDGTFVDLYFNLNTIYSIIQKQWFPMFRITAPSKNDVCRWIKEEDKLFVRDRVCMRINPNLQRTQVMEYKYLPNKDEINE